LRPFRPKTTRLALAAVALLALSARRAKADAIYTVTDLGTDTVVTSPGHLVTVPDTAIRLLPSDLQTPRTQNADGFSVVNTGTPGGPTTAELAPPGSPAQVLGTLGGSSSTAVGLNDADAVVGYSALADGSQHAFLAEGGRMFDLNALIPAGSGYTLTRPVAIADDGRIGVLATRNGIEHALVLTPDGLGPAAPVPEPASWVILLTLSAVSGLILRRQRQRTGL
jgi:probable HAF family extracellular repeat protein